LRSWSANALLGAVVLGAIISVVLGVLQLTGEDGSWYFYRITNLGVAVGAFANGNHFATLLLVAIPALAAMVATVIRTGSKQQRMLAGAVATAAGAALLVGALMNSSAAFLLLGPPVIAASVLLATRLSERRIRQGIIAIAALLVIAAGGLAILGDRVPGWGTSASIETRTTFWKTTVAAAATEGVAGSGFGTFQKVYGRYENPASVDRFYVNHAHNDYLELALEGGIPAIILILGFLAWWMARAHDAWLRPTGTIEQRAAAVASAAILLHSLFDYPLRTAAIMAMMAVPLALLGGARGQVLPSRTGEAKARHATL
jgi:O-antigen ligase